MQWTLLHSAMCVLLLSRAALAVDVPGTVPADFVVPIYRPIPAEGPDVLVLDGTWRANRNPPAKVQEAAIGGSQWSDFHVPGQWHAQQLPIGEETVAALGKDFELPAAWRGKRIFLRFDAVHGGTVYWFNGVKLAATERYWTPVELEITAQALPGETNRLRLTQTRNVFSEQLQFNGYRTQRHPPETGIPRSVRVFALPPLHVSTLHVVADLDKDYRDGELLLDVKLDNPQQAAGGLSLAIALSDPAGLPVAPDREFALGPLNPGASERKFRLPVKAPLTWNAEKPALYILTADLRRNGQTLQHIWRTVGFRKIEVRGSQVLLNGQVLKLAGACHHEYDPFTQRSDTARHAEGDVLWMKAANMNFARTTHYPPTAEFLDACDRLGLYAEVECPFMWTRIPAQDEPAHVRQFLAPTAAAVEYHRDHPSVILWSLANESGSKTPSSPRLPANYQATHKLVKRLDPTRLTSFHNEWDFDDRVPSVGNLHYPPMPFDGTTWIEGDPRPIMLGEAFITANDHWQAPLLRNDRGIHEELFMDRNLYWFAWGLQPNPTQARWWQEHKPCGQNNPWSAWAHVYNSPRLLGMNLWEYGAHRCGFVDDWRRPKPEFWGMKRMLTPVYIPVRQVDVGPETNALRIPIENRYSFTDLNECRITWKLSASGVIGSRPEASGDAGRAAGGQGTRLPGTRLRVAASVPPRSKGSVEVRLPPGAAGKILVICSHDAKGHLIDAHGIQLGKRKESPVPRATAGCPEYGEDGREITVRCAKFALALDRPSGRIRQVEGHSRSVLQAMPAVYMTNAWQGGMNTPLRIFGGAENRVIDSVVAEKRDRAVAIIVRDHCDALAGRLQLLLDADGTAETSFDYIYSGEPFRGREIGLELPLDLACQTLTWRRQSEWDVYPDDQIGRPQGTANALRASEEPQPRPEAGLSWSVYPAMPEETRYRNHPKSPWPWTSDLELSEAKTRPWSLDMNDGHGTRDFASTKFHVFEARLYDSEGRGVTVFSDGRANVRAGLSKTSVLLHLWQPGEAREVPRGARLEGRFTIFLAPPISAPF